MTCMDLLEKYKIIAIMRKVELDDAMAVFQSLKKGGIKVIEVTLDSLNAFEIIKQLSMEASNDMLVGAGTVLDPESAKMTINHGANFIISPALNLKTVEMTKRHGVLSIPGYLTPTEIITAYENGADMVKVFPANSMGANYFKDLSGPFSNIPFIATGGINENNICTYLDSGVAAIGLGSSLVPKRIFDPDD